MNKKIYPHFDELAHIKKLYKAGKNITSYFKNKEGIDYNTSEAIQISYDLQAGTYIKHDKENPNVKDKFTSHLASIINNYSFSSILEVGVGEATTLANLIPKLDSNCKSYGFDISWSRIKLRKIIVRKRLGGVTNVELFTGDLFNIPIMSNSIDIVYTAHSLEPNGGREIEALKELYRVANKYIVLLEPAYELASEEAKERMKKLSYVKGLPTVAKELGYNIIEYRLFDYSVNSLNPTGLIIIKKRQKKELNSRNPLACPITKTPLKLYTEMNCYYSEESLLAYPVIGMKLLTMERQASSDPKKLTLIYLLGCQMTIYRQNVKLWKPTNLKRESWPYPRSFRSQKVNLSIRSVSI